RRRGERSTDVLTLTRAEHVAARVGAVEIEPVHHEPKSDDPEAAAEKVGDLECRQLAARVGVMEAADDVREQRQEEDHVDANPGIAEVEAHRLSDERCAASPYRCGSVIDEARRADRAEPRRALCRRPM